ncbi:hypothetical protein SAMN05192535_0268 [Shouchella rhizosphaerae]|nr:hypothetical protein SAMN05192535_0268 [Shouchella rhizosphaerae]
MNTQFHFDSTEVVLTFSKLVAITGLKRKLTIPYTTFGRDPRIGPFVFLPACCCGNRSA